MLSAMVVCRFVHFSAVLILFGSSLFRPLLMPRTPLNRSWQRSAGVLALIAFASALAWFLLVTADMAGSWSAAWSLETQWRVLSGTFFGQVWIVHLLACALLAWLTTTRWAVRDYRVLLLASAAALLTLAPVGHGAMLDGVGGQLLILNQSLHLLCVGAWLGGLLLLSLLLTPRTGQDPLRLLQRFSGMGYLIVAGLLATGLANVRAISGGFWPSPAFAGYGLVLAIKLVLVLCMLGLALFNRLALALGIERRHTLWFSVTLEWLCGLGAVGAVSLLGTLSPMGQ